MFLIVGFKHKRLPLEPVLSATVNPAYTALHCCCKFHFSIVQHCKIAGSLQVPPPKLCAYFLPPPYTRLIHYPSHCFDFIIVIL